jgi:hypothetical protein
VDPGLLSSGQRHAIGVRVEQMERLAADLRNRGLPGPLISELECELASLEADTGAIRPMPARGEVTARLSQLLVLASELDSRRLKSYGSLDQATSVYLDDRSARLSALVMRLVDDAETRAGELA